MNNKIIQRDSIKIIFFSAWLYKNYDIHKNK